MLETGQTTDSLSWYRGLSLEHYPDEKKQALEHLDFAIKEFQDMKMQPSLERAIGHKGIVKA